MSSKGKKKTKYIDLKQPKLAPQTKEINWMNERPMKLIHGCYYHRKVILYVLMDVCDFVTALCLWLPSVAPFRLFYLGGRSGDVLLSFQQERRGLWFGSGEHKNILADHQPSPAAYSAWFICLLFLPGINMECIFHFVFVIEICSLLAFCNNFGM